MGEAEDLLEFFHFGVVAGVLHYVAPLELAVDEQPLPAILAEIATIEPAGGEVEAGFEDVGEGIEGGGEGAVGDVFGFLGAAVEVAGHVELGVEGTVWVAIDGEAGAGAVAVGGDDRGLAAADEDGVEVWGGVELVVGGEGADVGFAGLEEDWD